MRIILIIVLGIHRNVNARAFEKSENSYKVPLVISSAFYGLPNSIDRMVKLLKWVLKMISLYLTNIFSQNPNEYIQRPSAKFRFKRSLADMNNWQPLNDQENGFKVLKSRCSQFIVLFENHFENLTKYQNHARLIPFIIMVWLNISQLYVMDLRKLWMKHIKIKCFEYFSYYWIKHTVQIKCIQNTENCSIYE